MMACLHGKARRKCNVFRDPTKSFTIARYDIRIADFAIPGWLSGV